MDIPSTHPIHRVYAALHRFRDARMQRFLQTFSLTPRTRVLDIGGAFSTWERLDVRPNLTLLNVYDRPESIPSEVRWVHGDARAMPFQPGEFDLVFSNSVIEHVGNWEDQQAFAREVHRLRASYWIQTPNRGFPVEPHVLGIGVQFLPRSWQVPYARFASLRGWMTRWNREAIAITLEQTRLLSAREMATLFPDATIWNEALFGLTKSIVAYRAIEQLDSEPGARDRAEARRSAGSERDPMVLN